MDWACTFAIVPRSPLILAQAGMRHFWVPAFARDERRRVSDLFTKACEIHHDLRRNLRLRAAAAARPAAAGRPLYRPAEVQFHRRQQRRRSGSGRRADRGGDRGAAARGPDARDLRARQRPAGLSARCANSWSRKLKRDAGIVCRADEILVTSGSLQALDLVNGVLLARGDTVLIEQECYQGSLNRLTRLGVKAVGIPLDRDGMRMDALAAALADLKRQGVRPKYIYTIPTVQNPTGTIMPEARRAETAAARRRVRRADLRGRLLRRPDLGSTAGRPRSTR